MFIALAIIGVGFINVAGAAAAQASELEEEQIPEWPVSVISYGGKLLLSDSPENVPGDGITYQDTINGEARLFFHHVNNTAAPKKIVVLLTNRSKTTVHVNVLQYGLGGPGSDYLAVGKTAQANYMSNTDVYTVDVPAQGSELLADSFKHITVLPGQLLNGIYDFKTDAPVEVKVMMMPVNADIKKFAEVAKILPKDKDRLRGTFEKPDRMLVPTKVYNPKTDAKVAITLADNQVDEYLRGKDATDGSETINYGNYGVLYKIYIPSAYNGKLACYMNPRGGEYAGAMSVKYRYRYLPPVLVPNEKLYLGSGTINDYSLIGTFNGGQSLWLNFSPPGASNLPVKLVIAPWLFNSSES